MANKVVLDALIPREDFDVQDQTQVALGRNKTTLSIPDLEYESFFFSTIRKPDFQRETNEWDGNKIAELIKSFIEGELVPAVILWRSSGNYIFVIDGSHRLSALSSWINNDYGDGSISLEYYGGEIPEEQKEIAEKTREIINSEIGPFKDYKIANRYPEKVSKYVAERAKGLGALALQVQWVEGNSKKAEESFFKINQQAAPIHPTELMLIKSRKKANGVAARAVIRSGKGHKYWSIFGTEKQYEIQKLATEIHTLLFRPIYETPIKTLDLPIGGKIFSNDGLTLVYETINIVNEISDKNLDSINDDVNGNETIKCLKRTKKILSRINSVHPSSLGLHPIVYFYSLRGRHKIASYYAVLSFVIYLEENKKFNNFIKIRKDFEEILLNYEFLVQQIVRKYRQSKNGYLHIRDYYIAIMENLLNKNDVEQTIDKIIQSKEFAYLKKAVKDEEEIKAKKFSKERKSLAFIVESVKTANRCAICNSLLHKNSITIDHKTRKSEGGLGTVENAQLAHPYCNSTYKN
ncbi:HNH endonuclease family protein [Marinisporobacter balticus]|uniref:HNH endonuclease n=1 Tax=Marinisporobacter balticus TaxID=2018667 RepID=A0A4R2L1M9_9FIRM|nr:DUF262 domain-containing protein [Marinisporobacter balticus]TCO79097.1 HNH endonuclease [Marinisporobacter balticus]